MKTRNTVVCTLFEGSYGNGLGVLINSLVKQGFSGTVAAGYRGKLPAWLTHLKQGEHTGPGASLLYHVNDQVDLLLIPLQTAHHFTNHKPDFMLFLWEKYFPACPAMIYMDPDIVVDEAWDSFEYWLEHGVALCEDVNSPMHENHPKRSAWRSYFAGYGESLRFKGGVYVNGGFVGVKLKDRAFVEKWKALQDAMAHAIGGLSNHSLAYVPTEASVQGVFATFSITDQDALNATVEATDLQVSIVDKTAMGLIPGRSLLPHALGQPKPWNGHILMRTIQGYPPRRIERMYWHYANHPIPVHGAALVARKRLALNLAAFIARFYSRK